MNDKKILENKFINIDQRDVDQVVAAIQQKQLAGTAKVVETYEQALAQYFKVNHALAVSSGTAALHLLLYLYQVGPGDEVIVPPTAPIMSALPIIAVGATPVFVDVEEDNFSYDLLDLEKKISPRTKAIVTVPMWGYAINAQAVKAVAEKHHIPLIEDASHCHGSKENGQFVGTVGDVSFFSTQERKMVTTGEGGIILTNDANLADQVKEIRDFGKPFRATPELKDHLGQYGYLFGLNFRLAAMSAALGISQIEKLPKKIEARTQNATAIRDKAQELTWLKELPILAGSTPNYYSMVLFVDHPRMTANEVARRLYNEQIISDTYRFGIKPLYELPIFNEFRADCPHAEHLLEQIITLPTHEGLQRLDLDRIFEQLERIA